MRVRLATLMLLAFVIRSAAAQDTFNSVWHHPTGLSFTTANSVFEMPDGYIVFAYGWALDGSVGAVHIGKFDLQGQLLWQKEHRRERRTEAGILDPVARILDTCFVAALTETGDDIPNATWLYWFNAEGDTISTRFLKSDSNQTQGTHGTRRLLLLADGGFLHCGWCAGYGIGTGSCITRLDNVGGILWERNYPEAQYIVTATELPDGGFMLGGSRPQNVDRAVVIRTDDEGDVQWTRYHGLHSITGGYPALLNTDGDMLMPGSWKSDPDVNTYDRWSSLYRYSATGEQLPRKDYFYSYNAEANFILEKANGNYWLVGRMFQYFQDPDMVTTVWELDAGCDTLWMRRYYYYQPDDAESGVSCVRATSDGGVVMCGYSKQGVTDPMPHLSSNWLIKLDEHGCLVPGCHTVGIEEVAFGLNDQLRVWPNPAMAGQPLQFVFELPHGYSAKGPLRAVLLDATGRMVQEIPVPSDGSPVLFGQTLSAGLYYLHVADGTRWLAGQKVVVE